ncbi:Rhodanese-related sulfurtransferase [Rheinheimera pacifica]|uniref:Rhodanese-related sulfurtransferase n=1 Tax=Rheinheimera pacifica TaxID=173990 RepID=A0A1H6KT57_9GAMM|nr:rhodanese-like domain-containing protein [Rheinheimera pacifica]SEH75059.1 Rhodanese-related sulfurtransferase [Rheinheimera pacifica]
MKTVTKADIKRMNEVNDEDFVLINALPVDAFNEKHIRTSINIPFPDNDNFVEDVTKVTGENKNRKIIVYCANKQCDVSLNAAKALDQAGFVNVYDYEGGMEDWESQKEEA